MLYIWISIILIVMIILYERPHKKRLSTMMDTMTKYMFISSQESYVKRIPWLMSTGISITQFLKLDKYFRVSLRYKLYLQDKIKKASISMFLSEKEVIDSQIGLFLILIIYSLLLAPFVSSTVKLVLIGLIVYGLFWPIVWINQKIRIRNNQIKKELPFVLNSIALVTKSGKDFFSSIEIICTVKKGYFIEELILMLEEVKIGVSRVEALERMSKRIELREVNLFVSSATQAIEKGSRGVSETIEEIAKQLWENRKNTAKSLGEKASIKLFLPMLLLVFPTLMIYILSPAIFSLMQYFF